MMSPSDWQRLLDERFPNGANIRAEGARSHNIIIPRLMVSGVSTTPDGVDVVEIMAIPVTMERDYFMVITEMQENEQGVMLKGVNQSWFVSGNVPTEGERAAALAEARKYEVFNTPMYEETP